MNLLGILGGLLCVFMTGFICGWLAGHYSGFCAAFEDYEKKLRGK